MSASFEVCLCGGCCSRLCAVEYSVLLEKAGLSSIRFHDLRHSAATLLLKLSVHPKIVQELLGHTQISMTIDVYSHVLPGMHQENKDRTRHQRHSPLPIHPH